MTTFKEIRGQLIKSLSSDPSPATAGDMWYNSTSQTLKGVVLSGAWSSGNNMNVKRSATIAGTVTAGLASFGYIYPPSSPEGQSVLTEEYNGTNWTAVNNANTARYQVNSTGSQTAAVVLGGASPIKSDFESYDGTNWTSLTSLPAGRAGSIPMCGISTAVLATGGNDNVSGEPIDTTFEWDRSSWTTGTSYPTSTNNMTAVGTQTAALFAGGSTNAPGSTKTANAFTYDGTNFSSTGSLPVASGQLGGRSGTQTAALFAGGESPINNVTLDWNGSVFAVNPASPGVSRPSIGQASMSNSGNTATSALVAAAGGVPNFLATEEYNTAAATKTFTTS